MLTRYTHLMVFFGFFTAALLMFNITTAHANAKAHYPIGEIVMLQGKAWAGDGDNKANLSEGDPVYFHSTITTGLDARLLILFIDDTEITLGEEARLTIDEYIFDPYDANENKAAFSMKGAFLWTSGMISKREEPQVDIKTPKGSIGIRGTQFWGGEIKDGYGVFVTDGLVEFAGDWGRAEIERDKGVIIGNIEDEKSQIREPKEWAKNTLETALKTIAFKAQGSDAFEQKMQNLRKENIRKRHDYRGRMFPYKENPFREKLKVKEKDFFSDDFEEMRNRK